MEASQRTFRGARRHRCCGLGGAFIGVPREGRVEIADFTLPHFERRGIATLTAQELCAIAARARPTPMLVAKTLPGPNPSTSILRRLGFAHVGDTHDDEIGTAWLWERAP